MSEATTLATEWATVEGSGTDLEELDALLREVAGRGRPERARSARRDPATVSLPTTERVRYNLD